MPRDRFDWDRHNIAHLARHDVTPAEFEECLANGPVLMEIQLDESSGEERVIEVGHTNLSRVLLIVWTPRANRIRPVTAFPADRRTQDVYVAERFGRFDGSKQ